MGAITTTRGAGQPRMLRMKRVVTAVRIDWSRSSLTTRRCRSLRLSGSTVSKSVPQYRHRRAMALIDSPQAGHFLVSPQAESGASTAAFSALGALSQP